MSKMLLGRKIGMTRIYTPSGALVPVTIIQAGPCFISQIKRKQTDGYSAVQLAFEDVKPRRTTCPMISHDHKAGLSPKKFHKEARLEEAELEGVELGQSWTVAMLSDCKYVDVVGVSKGKGTQGTMKLWNFKGLCASHGTERKHRSPGAIASYGNERGRSGGPKKGKKMPGRMGNKQVTMRSLDIIEIDAERNLLMVKGPVPGSNNGFVIIRPSVRLYKSKAAKVG